MFPHTEGWAHPIRSATQLRTLMPATPSASPGHDSSSSVLSSCLVPWELPAPSGPPHLVSLLSQGLLWLTYEASPPLRTKLWARNAAGSSIQRLFLGGGGRINEFPWNDSRHGRVKPPGLGLCPVLITTLLRLPTVTPAGLSAWHFRHTVSLGKCYLYSIQSTKSAQHEEN